MIDSRHSALSILIKVHARTPNKIRKAPEIEHICNSFCYTKWKHYNSWQTGKNASLDTELTSIHSFPEHWKTTRNKSFLEKPIFLEQFQCHNSMDIFKSLFDIDNRCHSWQVMIPISVRRIKYKKVLMLLKWVNRPKFILQILQQPLSPYYSILKM